MSRILDYHDRVEVIPTVISGSTRGGIIQETNSGALILASAQDGNPRLYRSDDNGATWSLRQTMTVALSGVAMRGAFVDSRGHIYMGGGTNKCFWSTYGVPIDGKFLFAELWKSSDDGLTWRKVCTGEAGTFWHISEDPSGRIYVNEYSLLDSAGANGPTWPGDYGTIPDEYPAVNVWRSDIAGETFTKWYSAPKPTGAGLRDGTRHIHAVYADRAGRVFVTAGDYSASNVNLRWAGIAGKVVRIDAGGTIDIDYGQFGNGSTSFIDTPTGPIIVGKDNDLSGIDIINPALALSCQQCNLPLEFGKRFDTYIFDLWRGNDGVIFGNGNLSTRYALILFSTDDGASWGAIDVGNVQAVTMTYNPTGPSNRIFMSGGTLKALPCPSAVELLWQRPFYVPPSA